LFEAFTQVDASTTREYGGTGLGLSIVKKLCELMAGDIQINNEIDCGSCFEFTVRLKKSHKSNHVIPRVNMKTLNLLIVDDNETNREVLRGQLEHWGATVEDVESGLDALNLIAKRMNNGGPLFDVAFLDFQMPDMDGAGLGQRIRANQNLSSMKLVMMTSIAHQGNKQYFANLGFSAYFSKPATTSDLFNALSVIVE